MKTSNSAYTKFIDEKFVPLSSKARLIITLLIIVIPAVIFFFAYYQPKSKQIVKLDSKKVSIQNEIAEVKAKAANLNKFKKELKLAETQFLESAVLLPKEKEIPQLLKDISSLGRTAGLDFNTFKPLSEVPKDFYAEIPVTIDVRGPYHNMGFFFDQVSKLERIVSVTNVKMTSPQKEGGEMLLNSNCKLLTYMFTNKERPKPKKK